MTTQITDAFIERHREFFVDVPDLERGLYVLQTWQKNEPNTSPYKFIKAYMIRDEATKWLEANVIPKLDVAVIELEKPEKRKDKYARLERLALENFAKEYTTQELVDISGLGAQTIALWAKTEGFFRAVPDVRGKWEARNPKEDRKNSL